MKKILVLIFLLSPTMARGNIALSPLFIEFDADSRNRSQMVRFTNTTGGEMEYTIRLVNFKQESDGSYTPVKTPSGNDMFADAYLEFSPRLAKLKPMDSQVIRIQRRGMAAARDGEYVSHLLIQETAGENKGSEQNNGGAMTISLRALYGVSIPVMIKKGAISSSATIKDSTINDGYATATIRRNGDRSFIGTVIIRERGKEIGRINDFRIFTTTKQRRLKIPLNKKPDGMAEIILIDGRKNEVLETKNI